MLSSTVVPMPANDKDFEEKCVVLFCGLLGDPNVKTVGSRGLGQHGLDLLGARARDPNQPVGVQCKLRTKGDRLTEAEVRYLVEREWARSADDVLWRRTKLGLRLDPDQSARLAAFMATLD